eukprot:540082-Ditylum_brightwellii.AAC.1
MGIFKNAADLMSQKILFLPTDAQLALKKMACIGSRCDITILHLICNSNDSNKHPPHTLSKLDIAVEEGLLNKNGSEYCFEHNQIESTAYSLIPEKHRGPWHLSIGKKLLAQSRKAQHERRGGTNQTYRTKLSCSPKGHIILNVF